MTVSSKAGGFSANGAGHTASGTASCPVLKFKRRDTGDGTFKTVLSVGHSDCHTAASQLNMHGRYDAPAAAL